MPDCSLLKASCPWDKFLASYCSGCAAGCSPEDASSNPQGEYEDNLPLGGGGGGGVSAGRRHTAAAHSCWHVCYRSGAKKYPKCCRVGASLDHQTNDELGPNSSPLCLCSDALCGDARCVLDGAQGLASVPHPLYNRAKQHEKQV